MNEELTMWQIELERAKEKLIEAEYYDNYGDKMWFTEQMRWAEYKIKQLEAKGA